MSEELIFLGKEVSPKSYPDFPGPLPSFSEKEFQEEIHSERGKWGERKKNFLQRRELRVHILGGGVGHSLRRASAPLAFA